MINTKGIVNDRRNKPCSYEAEETTEPVKGECPVDDKISFAVDMQKIADTDSDKNNYFLIITFAIDEDEETK